MGEVENFYSEPPETDTTRRAEHARTAPTTSVKPVFQGQLELLPLAPILQIWPRIQLRKTYLKMFLLLEPKPPFPTRLAHITAVLYSLKASFEGSES